MIISNMNNSNRNFIASWISDILHTSLRLASGLRFVPIFETGYRSDYLFLGPQIGIHNDPILFIGWDPDPKWTLIFSLIKIRIWKNPVCFHRPSPNPGRFRFFFIGISVWKYPIFSSNSWNHESRFEHVFYFSNIPIRSFVFGDTD